MTLRSAVREAGAIALKLGFFLGVLHPLRKTILSLVPRSAGAEGRVLVVQLDNLGDIALALGALKSVVAGFPDKEVTLVVDRASETVARQVAGNVIAVDRKRLRGGIIYAIRAIGRIKMHGFGTLVHHTTIQMGLADYFSLVALAGADERIGYAGEEIFRHPHRDHWYDRVLVSRVLPRLERVYTKLVPSMQEQPGTITHVLHHYEAFDKALVSDANLVPHLSATAPEQKPYVVIGLGAAVTYRRWPVERFAAIAKVARDMGREVILTGIGSERPLAEAFLESFPDAEDLVGRTSLQETLDLVAGADAVIANETALVHLAVALKRPVVCILGGGHYGRCSLHGYRTTRWAHVDVGCDGDNWTCGRSLPSGTPSPCIDAIGVDLVTRELEAALAAGRAGRDAGDDIFRIP